MSHIKCFKHFGSGELKAFEYLKHAQSLKRKETTKKKH